MSWNRRPFGDQPCASMTASSAITSLSQPIAAKCASQSPASTL
jgi:hypothetical protein